MVTVCTIAARNYIAHVRVLASSFFQHHPEGRFVFLLIDDETRQFETRDEAFECVRLSDIGLDRSEIGRLAAIYEVTELSTAVKPLFLRHLLRDDGASIVYLDPDIKIFGSLEYLSRLAIEHSIVLTPHVTGPMPRDNRRIDEFQILASGIYNLGFVAVGPDSVEFLDWWWKRTRREARCDPTQMMFTDQRWVDFVPSFWSHLILRDTSCNVAYWNLHGRELTWDGDRYLVDGRPLTFFHFSGFDAKRPYLLSKHQGERPRVLLSENPALQRLCAEYLADSHGAGHEQASASPYGWRVLPSGEEYSARMRRLYREGLEAHEAGRGPEPPCPFDRAAPGRFVDWLNEPVAVGVRARIPRFLYSIYQAREDLRGAFPNLAGDDGHRFMQWVRDRGIDEERIPVGLRPSDLSPSNINESTFASASELSEGVNIVGYLQASSGIGEVARLLTTAVESAGVSYTTIAYGATQHSFHQRGDGRAIHDINILCVNADQTPIFAREAGPRFFDARHTAGYWFWELEQFPETMHSAFDYVDEVWTATRFVAGAIRAVGRKPVYTIPPPMPVPRCSPDVTRLSLGLPSGFMFLCVFDFFSILERKNPIGLITAFQRAFQPNEGPTLVIKTINGESRLNDLERVRAAARDRSDILIVDKYYSTAEQSSLMNLCDCYVSLHRSEGLGLTLAEAMGLEKPVIATGYSGNLDFMTAENSYLVDYVTGHVPEGCLPYPKGVPWAEPNLDQAAYHMRRVFEAPREVARKAKQGRQDILTKHSVRIAGAAVRQRIEEIGRARRQVIVQHPTSPVARAHEDSAPAVERAEVPSFSMSSIEEITPLLTPTPSVAAGRRFRWPLLTAQRLLFRILRPYWFQQRQAQAALIANIDNTLVSSMRTAERHRREALESLWSAVQKLDAHLARSDAHLTRSDVQSAQLRESLWVAQHDLSELAIDLKVSDTRLSALQNDVKLSDTRLSALQNDVKSSDTQRIGLGDSVRAFQEAAATHLKALTEALGLVTSEVTSLSRRLYAAPYTDPPNRFVSEMNGKPVIGFNARREVRGNIYLGFEEIFRGSEVFIRDRFRVYLKLLPRDRRVVDIGCGRGELLDLLREAGISAIGVDIDEGMVRRCRAKGHDVEQIDALGFLRAQPDRSLPCIFSAQLVEHLSYKDLISFLDLSRAKLAPGGQLIFETVNPHALEAYKTFWTDLTHERPIFPEVAVAWCWLLGFDSAYVWFPHGSDDLEHDRSTQGEYAVVAEREGE